MPLVLSPVLMALDFSTRAKGEFAKIIDDCHTPASENIHTLFGEGLVASGEVCNLRYGSVGVSQGNETLTICDF